MIGICKIITTVLAFVVLGLFISVAHIINTKQEDKTGLKVAIFIIIAQALQIIFLLI